MPPAAACRRKLIVAVIAASIAGCAPEARRLADTIPHPGPAAYQRAAAIQHDPYLLDDVGPEVVGARPREYQRPLNEVERSRLAATTPLGIQPATPPGIPVGPPTPIGPAYPVAPAPVTAPYAPAPAPIVTTPPPAPPQTTPFQYQQRPPY